MAGDTVSYSLKPGEKPRIEIHYTHNFKNIPIFFDGEKIGEIANLKEARKGVEFTLPDKSILRFKKEISPQYKVYLNGKQLRNCNVKKDHNPL